MKNIDPKNIVYSDETGIDDNEVPLRGWALRGERCKSKKKCDRKIRINIIAALNQNNLFAPFIFEGYSNSAVYETYIEKVLVPSLKANQVVIIDNARFHKSKKVETLIESVGCKLIFLPPYSPDFNPIEHIWSKVKGKIRSVASNAQDFYTTAVQTLGEMCLAESH